MKIIFNYKVMGLVFFGFCYLFCGLTYFGCGKMADTTTSSTSSTTSTSTTSTSTSTATTTSTTTTLPYVATPSFALSSGSYEVTSLYVTIECVTTGEVDIYYSLDGTIPTTTESTLYSSPFSIEASKIVRAIAVKSGMQNSLVATHWYDLYWWQALGTGVDSSVNTLLYVPSENCLYAGGSFTNANGASAKFIAKWNGTTWSAVGGGMTAAVYALAYGGSPAALYAGGNFITSEGTTTNKIAKWNGTTWEALGSGVVGSKIVYALAYDDNAHALYAGGSFTSIGGNSANRIAKWGGISWEAVGLGANNSIFSLAVGSSANNVYAGGMFSTAGGSSSNKIAHYTGSTWEGLGSYIEDTVNSNSLIYDSAAGDLFVASDATHKIAKYSGSTWSEIWGSTDSGSPTTIAYNSATHALYAGGTFTSVQGVNANYVARWTGSTWEALGTGMGGITDPFVLVLTCDPTTNTLYAGGYFTTAGGVTVNRVAKWGKIN